LKKSGAKRASSFLCKLVTALIFKDGMKRPQRDVRNPLEPIAWAPSGNSFSRLPPEVLGYVYGNKIGTSDPKKDETGRYPQRKILSPLGASFAHLWVTLFHHGSRWVRVVEGFL
jgi:hypothetical protein